MKKRAAVLCALLLLVGAAFAVGASGLSPSPPASAVERLRRDAGGEVAITWNARTGTPSFLRGSIPLSGIGLEHDDGGTAAALAFIERYGELLGVGDVLDDLIVVNRDEDALGMRHVTFEQVHQGVEVHGGHVRVHLSADGEHVVAASSSFVPGITLAETEPNVTAQDALVSAGRALPNGALVADPKLVVYPGEGGPGSTVHLAWLVELRDDAVPARHVYVIDAARGTILEVLDRLTFGRDRSTYDAGNGYTLPGTLARSEPDGPTGDEDVDDAHDFAGDTYDYYWSTHGRDSYDDEGATLVSTANYGSGYMNAFWNGTQTVYGDRFAVNDIVAHEWTHAVTEHSAALVYRWQSGALNESFSDIFGAMVDRDDWLMGEDMPPEVLGGRDAIRDLANPARLGQPGHTDDWVATCSDNEGVHTNSGIPSKAYYNIATAIGKEKAERIFYRALTVYLDMGSSLEDARAAALQSAADLYGEGGAAYTAVLGGFNAVGLDGVWEPEPNDCTCAVTTVLADEAASSDGPSALEVATTLYRVRDELLTGEAGEQYRALYEQHTGRISQLLLADRALRAAGREILRRVTPGLNHLLDGTGDEAIVTQETVDATLDFLRQVAEEDRASGGGRLAQVIEEETARIDWDRLVGRTYREAWEAIQSRVAVTVLYLPIVIQ